MLYIIFQLYRLFSQLFHFVNRNACFSYFYNIIFIFLQMKLCNVANVFFSLSTTRITMRMYLCLYCLTVDSVATCINKKKKIHSINYRTVCLSLMNENNSKNSVCIIYIYKETFYGWCSCLFCVRDQVVS